jgi:colanic acid biosynthesis glycosyl transferase WcaI
MRVAIVCEYFHPDNSGGTPTDLSELAQFLNLRYRGLTIEVVTSTNLYRPTVDQPPLGPTENWQGVSIIRLRTPRSNRPSMLLRLAAGAWFSLRALWHLLWQSPYDVVLIVTNPPANAFAARVYRALTGVPYVYFVNDLYPDIAVALGGLAPDAAATRAFGHLQRGWLNRAARVVVVGRCMRQHVHRHYAVPLARVDVVRNWADPVQIRPGLRENGFRQQHGLTGFVVLYGGNFSHYVDFNQILATAALLSAHTDISLVLIGNGVRRAEIISTVAEQKLTQVRVLPPVPRDAMDEVLAASNVALVPLDDRMLGLGSPGKLYSTLAAGRAVIGIVPPSSEVAQIIAEENCGVIVSAGDAGALATTILALRGDPARADAMGRNGRVAVERRFCLKRAGEDFHAILTDVAGTTRHPLERII